VGNEHRTELDSIGPFRLSIDIDTVKKEGVSIVENISAGVDIGGDIAVLD
jgi:hypothetical protein